MVITSQLYATKKILSGINAICSVSSHECISGFSFTVILSDNSRSLTERVVITFVGLGGLIWVATAPNAKVRLARGQLCNLCTPLTFDSMVITRVYL